MTTTTTVHHRGVLTFRTVIRTFFAISCLINLSSSRQHSVVSSRVRSDGEIETVVHYKTVTARELSSGDGSKDQHGYVLWEVTDGKHFVQSIYNGDMELWDCDFTTDNATVENFLKETRPPIESNKVVIKVDDYRLKKLTNYRLLKRECKRHHRLLRKHLKRRKQHTGNKRKRNGDVNGQQPSVARQKRGLFIYPGTNFCGVGSGGTNRTTSRADRCCRDHDHCPYMIEGWSTKYNIFNYRFQTLSHCHCDERFRACLKQINSSTANMIGYLYFTVVKMKCFVFKKDKICAKRSWWGRCIKYKKAVLADLRDPISY
ncbi:Uncharacterised protein g6246 [Pycnogonum litorale]